MYLNKEALRVVERDERGRVTYRKRYKYGDEVDTSHMIESHVDALVERGSLVESEDDLSGRGGRVPPHTGSQVTGAATGEAGDHSEIDEDNPDTLDVPEDDDGTSTEDDDDAKENDGEIVDRFSGMDYGELQDAARNATPPIAANQSSDNLRAALRERE